MSVRAFYLEKCTLKFMPHKYDNVHDKIAKNEQPYFLIFLHISSFFPLLTELVMHAKPILLLHFLLCSYIFFVLAENRRRKYQKEEFFMQQGSQQQTGSQMPLAQQFGAHELLDADEAIGTLVGGIEHFVLYNEYVKDQELIAIMQRQKMALTQIYNTILDTLKTGRDPQVKTQTYQMQQDNKSIYGMKPASSPKTPIQSIHELNDECISGAILGHLKAIASEFTLAALEATNPVLRRIFADSIPNVIEMAYEMYLYQNKHQYYQVAQLSQQDMQNIMNSYAPVNQQMSH